MPKPSPLRLPLRPAYTLIEILIAVAIVAILIGLSMPAIGSIRAQAQRSQCSHNIQAIARAALQYQDLQGRIPDAVKMYYAKPSANEPTVTDANGIPPGEMLADLLGPVVDSPTRVNSDPRYPFGPNWAVYLLPYVEKADLYQAVAPHVTAYQAYGDAWKKSKKLIGPGGLIGSGGLVDLGDILNVKGANEEARDKWREIVRQQVIPAYRCPSDTMLATEWAGRPPDCPGPWARGNYAANAGPGWWQMSLNGFSYKDSEYGSTGPVMGINFGINAQQVKDGAATTVMFNEIRAGVRDTDPRGAWAVGLPGSSVTASNAIGDCKTPNDRTEGSDDIDGCPKFYYTGIGTRDRMGCSTGIANLGWPSLQAQSRSLHRGGVNVAFCDGSVRFIHDYVSQSVWYSMLSSNDGFTFSFD